MVSVHHIISSVQLEQKEKVWGARALNEQHMYAIHKISSRLGLSLTFRRISKKILTMPASLCCDVVDGTELKLDSQQA